MTRTRIGAVATVALLAAIALAACGESQRHVTQRGIAMEPGIPAGTRVAVDDPPKKLKTGMVVVFDAPNGWLESESKGGELIKRIIGVAGDRVVCCDDEGRVTINGKPLNEESYLPQGAAPSDLPFDVTVPAGHVWVLGDNRQNSADSRVHLGDPGGGFVPIKLVNGVVKGN